MELINAKLDPYIKLVNAHVVVIADFTSPFETNVHSFYLIRKRFYDCASWKHIFPSVCLFFYLLTVTA
jgi:hypothetical protein